MSASADMLDLVHDDHGLDQRRPEYPSPTDGRSNSPTVIAAHRYKNGRRVAAVALDRVEPISEDPTEFVWIGLCEPSDMELRSLQSRFGLHPLAVEDALKAHQLPKVDVYGDQLFITTRTALIDDGQIAYGETSLFAGSGFIISVRHGSARAHSDLRAQLESSPLLLQKGVDYVLHAILDFIVDGYLPIVEAIEEEVLAMERRALDSFLDRGEVQRIFARRRDLMRFQRILGPMTEVCARHQHIELPCIDMEVAAYFKDVHDHVRRVELMVRALRETLSNVFEVITLLEQQRQGAITRQLAAWAAILAVPTAIAGIYGMNFENMPELKTEDGYYWVIGLILGLCTFLYLRFKHARWL